MASRYSTRSGRLSSAKEKEIKKINERRAQIARDVQAGKLPQDALNRYENAMRAVAGDFINKSGNIAHGKAAQAAISKEALDALLQRSTSGQLQRDIKKQVAEEYDKSAKAVTPAEIQQYISDVDFVNARIEADSDRAYDSFKAAFQGKKGRKTYKQLRAAIEAYDNEYPSGSEPENPFRAEEVYFT